MPITTAEQLAALQERVRTAVLNDPSKALKILTEALPEGRAKYNQTLVLTGRDNDIAEHEIGNTLAPDLLAILRNELRKDLLVFTDHLTLADFGPKPNIRPELNPGHLLYKVPPVMKLREPYECIIRIAHQLNQVLEGIEMDESVGLGEVSVSEVMEIEVIDPSAADNRAFDILLLSDGEQFVDEYSATEWVFNVRPLREGSHSLVLKISVLITINGKERTKNIVHQRAIAVRAEAVEAGAETGFVRPAADSKEFDAEVLTSPFAVPTIEEYKSGSPPPPAPPTEVYAPSPMESAGPNAPRKRSNRSGFLSIAATVLLLVVAAFLIIPNYNENTGAETTESVRNEDSGVPAEDYNSVDTLTPVLPPSLRDSL